MPITAFVTIVYVLAVAIVMLLVEETRAPPVVSSKTVALAGEDLLIVVVTLFAKGAHIDLRVRYTIDEVDLYFKD